jgi:HEAT repeat protein/CHAT domain-containing protein
MRTRHRSRDQVSKQLRALREGSKEERLDACHALAGSIDDRVVKGLVAALEDDDDNVCRAATFALVELGSARCVGALYHLTQHSKRLDFAVRGLIELAQPAVDPSQATRLMYDPQRRKAAARALAVLARAFLEAPQSIGILTQMLEQHVNRSRCESAVSILQHIGEPAVGALLAGLAQGGRAQREGAARGLAAVNWVPTNTREGALYWIAMRNWVALSHMGRVAVEPLLELLGDAAEPIQDRSSALGVLAKIGDVRAVQVALTMLDAPEASLKQRVVGALGRLSDGSAVKPLVAMLRSALRSRDLGLSCPAAEALGLLGDPCAIPVLCLALAHEDGFVRRAAEQALAELHPASRRPLCDALGDRQASVRAGAARALGRPGNAECVDALTALLEDEATGVRESAAYALGKIGDRGAVPALVAKVLRPQPESTGELDDLVIPPFPEAHDTLDKHNVQSIAAWALGEIRDSAATDGLLEAYTDAPSFVKAAILSALAKLDPERAIDPLIDALGEENVVCRAAALCLGQLGVARAVDPLYQALKRLRKYGLVSIEPAKLAVIEALAKCGKSGATEFLRESLDDPDWRVRVAAIRALGRTRDPRAVAPLLECAKRIAAREEQSAAFEALKTLGKPAVRALVDLLHHLHSHVQEQAAYVLGEIGDPSAVEPLALALERRDRAPSVRLAAVRSLAAIGGQDATAALGDALEPGEKPPRRRGDLSRTLRRAGILPPLPATPFSWDEREEAEEENQLALQLEAILSLGSIGRVEVVDALISALKHEQAEVRRRAATALAHCADSRSVRPLVACLEDWEPTVRAATAAALARMRDGRAVAGLRTLLEDDAPTVREQAAGALDACGWKPRSRAELATSRIAKGEWERCAELGAAAIEPLTRRLEDLSSPVREAALEALARCPETAAQPALLAALRSGRTDVRRRALGTLARRTGACVDEAVTERLCSDPDQGVRRAALAAIRHRGTALPLTTFKALLDDEDAEVRCLAVEALGQSANAAAVELLTNLLQTDVNKIRLAALSALGELRLPEAFDPIVSALSAAAQPAEIRAAAAIALGRFGSVGAFEPLIAQLTAADVAVRESAAQALRVLANENTLGAYVFTLHLGAPPPSVRDALVDALRGFAPGADLGTAVDPAATLATIIRAEAERRLAQGRAENARDCFMGAIQCYRAAIDDAGTGRDLLRRAVNFCFQLGLDGVKLFAGAREPHCAGAIVVGLVEVARSLGNDRGVWGVLAEACNILARAGEDAVTLAAYLHVVELIETTWFMQPQEDETRLRGFFSDKADLYDGLALCYQRLGAPAEAWQVLEAAKTRYLGDLIARRQGAPVRAYSRVTEDVWQSVRRASSSGEGGDDTPAGLRELVGVEPAASDETSVAVPQHRQALSDSLDKKAEPDAGLRLVDELWQSAAALTGHPLAPSVREAFKPLRRFIDETLRRPPDPPNMLEARRQWSRAAIMRVIVSEGEQKTNRTSHEQRSDPSARYFGLLRESDEALQGLRRNVSGTGLSLPFNAFEGFHGDWADIAGTSPPYPESFVLQSRALLEVLNLICNEGKVFVATRPRMAGDRPPAWRALFDKREEPASRRTLIQEAGDQLAAEWGRVRESKWRHVIRLARGQTSSFAGVRSFLSHEPQSAVLALHLTRHGTIAYLFRAAPAQGELLPAQSQALASEAIMAPEFTLAAFEAELNQNWLKPLRALREPDLDDESERAARTTLDRVLGSVYDKLLQPIDRRLRAWGIRRIIIIPHRGLHVLPLHACWQDTAAGRRYLTDRYEVVYAPSFTLSEICRERAARRRAMTPRLFAHSDPTSELIFTGEEVRQVARCFREAVSAASSDVLRQMQGATHIHFSCHARYDFDEPLESGLDLGNAWLSVGDLFAQAPQLPESPQVVLSACESGLVSSEDLADEYLGIASGFLFAGASAVVSTLWAVNDLPTMLLMERFYYYELRRGLSAAAALRKAQLWLRKSVTARWLRDRFQKKTRSGTESALPAEVSEQLREHFSLMAPDAHPFAHPYDWAAFALSGA